MRPQQRGERVPSEFDEKIVQVNRVSKKTKGGNKVGFSVLAVVGDKKGRVGVGLGGAPDVSAAVRKAVSYAKKHLLTVPMKGTTIPHEVQIKLGAARVMLKPAPPGTGVVAGSKIRSVLEMGGIKNVIGKSLGSNNPLNQVKAMFKALSLLKNKKQCLAERREKEPYA